MKCIVQAWQRHEGELRGYLRHHLLIANEAEDLLQDVFIKAIRHRDAFCQLDNARAWLFQVTRHALIDRLRTTHPSVKLPDDLMADNIEIPPVLNLAECLPRALAALSSTDREAIQLCDLDDLPQQDYAKRMNMTLPAAKSRLQRARLRLRAKLVQLCGVRFDETGAVCCHTGQATYDKADQTQTIK